MPLVLLLPLPPLLDQSLPTLIVPFSELLLLPSAPFLLLVLPSVSVLPSVPVLPPVPVLPSVPFLLSVSPSVFGHRRHRRHRPLRSHHRDSMLFAWVREQIGLWRLYTVVAARSQMAPPLVDEALLLLRVPLVDQWSCRVKSARTSVDPQMTI